MKSEKTGTSMSRIENTRLISAVTVKSVFIL